MTDPTPPADRVLSDDELRTADKIILMDPNRPDWVMPVYDRILSIGGGSLKIPVDSHDSASHWAWTRRIRDMRLDPTDRPASDPRPN